MSNKGVNKVIIIGHLGNDPQTPTDNITNISIATTNEWVDKSTGEVKEDTEWHKVVGYGGLAGVMSQYLKKGSKVYIEGRLKTRNWKDKDSGKTVYSTEVVADEMQMLDKKEAAF